MCILGKFLELRLTGLEIWEQKWGELFEVFMNGSVRGIQGNGLEVGKDTESLNESCLLRTVKLMFTKEVFRKNGSLVGYERAIGLCYDDDDDAVYESVFRYRIFAFLDKYK